MLFLYNAMDDFVMHGVGKFGGRELRSAEAGNLDLPAAATAAAAAAEKKAAEASEGGGVVCLSDAEVAELGKWLTTVALPKKVAAVKTTARLSSTPALLTDTESAPLRRMNRLLDGARESANAKSYVDHLLAQGQTMEVNPAHPIIVALHREMKRDESLAIIVAEQVCACAAAVAADEAPSPPRVAPRAHRRGRDSCVRVRACAAGVRQRAHICGAR